jgi:hypothetical protein
LQTSRQPSRACWGSCRGWAMTCWTSRPCSKCAVDLHQPPACIISACLLCSDWRPS